MSKYWRFNRLLVVKSAVLARSAVVVALFLAVQAGAPVALAAQTATSLAMDQAVENPGLLPTNPFYFLKSFVRNTQRALTVSPVKLANLELDILSQKAGELKRLQEILDGADENLKSATVPYRQSIDRLQANLQNIKSSDKSSAVDQLLSRILESGIKHMILFDELSSLSDSGMRDRLEFLDARLSEVMADTLTRLDSSDRLRDRLAELASQNSNNLMDEILFVRSLGRLEDKLSDDSFARDIISLQKDQMLMGVIADMENRNGRQSVPDLIDGIPGNILRTMTVVDEIRERIGDLELKNTLAIVRQHLLDDSEDTKSASKPEAGRMLDEANRLIKLAGNRNSGVKNKTVNLLISRAKFNLTQAEVSFKAGQYGDAFGQASAATASVKNALVYLALNSRSAFEFEVKQLKSFYDSLISQAENLGVDSGNSADLFNLFARAEKFISALSDLKGDKINLDKAVPALRDADLLVERADVFLRNLAEKIEEASLAKRSEQPLIERVLPANEEKEKEIKKEAIEEVNKAIGN